MRIKPAVSASRMRALCASAQACARALLAAPRARLAWRFSMFPGLLLLCRKRSPVFRKAFP
jgi:hypothetical protein